MLTINNLKITISIFIYMFFCCNVTVVFSEDRVKQEELYQLGICYRIGKNGPIDLKKAAHYFMKAAKMNHNLSQYEIGKMYLKGQGVNKNIMKGLKWLNKSADSGNIYALDFLGGFYEQNENIEPDVTKALSYYQIAAENGSATSQYRLGRVYYEGKIVAKNYEKAIHYLTSAAKGDNVLAQFTLGEIYTDPLKFDKTKAYFWYSVAYKRWKHLESEVKRRSLRKVLTKNQIELTEKEAASWVDDNLKILQE